MLRVHSPEQAPLPAPLLRWLSFWWCCSSTAFGIMASIVGPTATILALNAHCSEADLAPIVAVGGLCTMLGGMPSGWLLDTFPAQGNRIIGLALLLEAIGYSLLPYCTTVWQLTCVYAACSLCFNLINTGINVLSIWAFQHSAPQLALMLNMVSATFTMGGILAPQLVNLSSVALGSGAGAYYMTSALVLLLGLVVGTAAGPLPRAAPKEGSGMAATTADPYLAGEQADQETGCSRAAASPALANATPQSSGEACDPHTRSLVQVSCTDKWAVLLPALAVVFSNVSIELGYASWLYVYARDVAGLGDFQAETVTSCYWLAFTGGRLAAAGLSSWVPAATLLLWSMPLAIVGAVVPLLAPGPVTIWASVLLVGLGASCGFPSTLSLTAAVVQLDGHLNGVISTVAGLSTTLMPSLVPVLAKYDPERGFTWLMICTLAMAVAQYACLGRLVQSSRAAQLQLLKAAAGDGASSKVCGATGHTSHLPLCSPSADDLLVPLLMHSQSDS